MCMYVYNELKDGLKIHSPEVKKKLLNTLGLKEKLELPLSYT